MWGSHPLLDTDPQRRGRPWTTARASLHRAVSNFRHWPLELAFHYQKGCSPTCPYITARNMATLLTADLHPTGAPEIWSGNQIPTSFSSRIPIQLDEDGCLKEPRLFYPSHANTPKLAPLWESGVHTRAQILGRAPYGRPYFLDERKLQWANPAMKFPFPHTLTHALKYMRVLHSSTEVGNRRRLSKNITSRP